MIFSEEISWESFRNNVILPVKNRYTLVNMTPVSTGWNRVSDLLGHVVLDMDFTIRSTGKLEFCITNITSLQRTLPMVSTRNGFTRMTIKCISNHHCRYVNVITQQTWCGGYASHCWPVLVLHWLNTPCWGWCWGVLLKMVSGFSNIPRLNGTVSNMNWLVDCCLCLSSQYRQ